jgi:hypothetical protein
VIDSQCRPMASWSVSFAQGRGSGRSHCGRGRGHIKDTITVPIRSHKRQKEPSVTLIFCKLQLSSALSRQRSRVRAPSSPPHIPKIRIKWQPTVATQSGSNKPPTALFAGIFLLFSDPGLTRSSLQPCSVRLACSSSRPACKRRA